MLGSKIRSWMENHIVRSKKKGKQKHNNSNGSSTLVQNDSNFSKYSPDEDRPNNTKSNGICNNISSPARRCEVSPIQVHSRSRFGWQSPSKEENIFLDVPKSLPYKTPKSPVARILSSIKCDTNSISTVKSISPNFDIVDNRTLKENSTNMPHSMSNKRSSFKNNLYKMSCENKKSSPSPEQNRKYENSNIFQSIVEVPKRSFSSNIDSKSYLSVKNVRENQTSENKKSLIRTNRLNGNINNFNNKPVGNVVNSLSSPESAYSTGYSTDGNSPGTSYSATPEYYINIRTGTHYFPKSINTLAIETQRFKFGLNKIEEMSPQDPYPEDKSLAFMDNKQNINKKPNLQPETPFQSPICRQRSRIRTNPWYSTSTVNDVSANFKNHDTFSSKRKELDSISSSSSGIKSSSDIRTDFKKSSESELSSSPSLESINKPMNIFWKPNCTIKATNIYKNEKFASQFQESDEDATLNEMIGKFDESYTYEKETDILSSESDVTHCPSDIDTGQDAEDECDTDDFLNFIDDDCSVKKGNIQWNSKYNGTTSSEDYMMNSKNIKRRKIRRKRKKSIESRRKSVNINVRRECKSTPVTPLCARRRNFPERSHILSPLVNRSNSMTLAKDVAKPFITLAESEKMLLRADLEADFKYRQLINEAEHILLSVKSSALSIQRETPVPSPRRICNPPPNKRVEMLRNCETEIKRDNKLQDMKQCVEVTALNKRLERLKMENNHLPLNSPKHQKTLSPKKNHITNFINQNVNELVPRSVTSSNAIQNNILNHNYLESPISKRKIKNKSKQNVNYSESDSDELTDCLKYNIQASKTDIFNQNHKVDPFNYKYDNNQNIPNISFSSIDVGTSSRVSGYCPQSEPLKRKIYNVGPSIEGMNITNVNPNGESKELMLNKLSNIRREREIKYLNRIF